MRASFISGFVSLLLFQTFFYFERSHGFTLTIGDRTYSNPAFKPALDAMADSIETEFNSSIASADNQKIFLGAQGNANAVSTRSFLSPGVMPADSKIDVSFGGSMAVALGQGASLSDGIKTASNQLPPVGVGAKTGLSVGASGRLIHLPIKGLDPNRVMYRASFYSTDLSSYIGKGITIKSMQASLGMSYQFYQARNWVPMIRFNGIQVTSGLSYSTFSANYRTPFNITETDSSTGTVLAWNNDVDIGVNSKVWSFTNEATIGVRLFWVLNLYTGFGLDFNAGSSQITGGSTGPVTGTNSGSTVFTGTGVVFGDSASVSPTVVQLRYLLGTEFDIGPVGIYVQGQAATPSVYAVNAGLHFVF